MGERAREGERTQFRCRPHPHSRDLTTGGVPEGSEASEVTFRSSSTPQLWLPLLVVLRLALFFSKSAALSLSPLLACSALDLLQGGRPIPLSPSLSRTDRGCRFS